ncbi:MAG: DUF2188 domain-containing protein [Minicystis sp.]
MDRSFVYHVIPDPDGWGWMVAAEGYEAHSLPYDTEEQALEIAVLLARSHPGSSIVVDEHAPTLTPVEIDHRESA